MLAMLRNNSELREGPLWVFSKFMKYIPFTEPLAVHAYRAV